MNRVMVHTHQHVRGGIIDQYHRDRLVGFRALVEAVSGCRGRGLAQYREIVAEPPRQIREQLIQ